MCSVVMDLEIVVVDVLVCSILVVLVGSSMVVAILSCFLQHFVVLQGLSVVDFVIAPVVVVV